MESIETKIEKLLRMADGGANENESAVALQMAQKLADAYNLDIGVIGKSGSRKDEQISKGLYPYQRTLYATIADLNHCKVWISKGLAKGSKYQTRLVGSKVNVALTKRICDYVEDVANRLVRENFEKNRFFSKDAHLFREGMIDRVVVRIVKRREEEEREREAAKREQDARMRHPGAATENAIVLISDVAREEEKANYDYLHGEGAWDRREAERLKRKQALEEAIAMRAAWERDNPELAAKEKADREAAYAKALKHAEAANRRREAARQRRINEFGYDPADYRPRKKTKYDTDAYWRGNHAGNDVGIDDQISHHKRESLV